jgi:hypothetical protein
VTWLGEPQSRSVGSERPPLIAVDPRPLPKSYEDSDGAET